MGQIGAGPLAEAQVMLEMEVSPHSEDGEVNT